MAYSFKQIEAHDPSNPGLVAPNASVTIFEPGDPAMTPLTLTRITGEPLPNPVTVNGLGYGPAFMHATLPQVAWAGGGLTGTFESYEGMRDEAIAARTAAENAAANAAAEAQTAIGDATAAATAAADAAGASALAAANSAALVDAPADNAIATAINGTGTATKAALSATYGRLDVTADATLANGVTDNRAYLQGLIDDAYTRNIPTIRIPRGNGTWKLSGHLDLWSGQTLNATGARIELRPDSNDFILGNKARVAVATVTGVGTTSGSSAITANGTFNPAHAGKQIAIPGAGLDGTSPLYGTYAHTSTSAGTVKPVVAAPGTVDIKALATVTGATAEVFDRDKDITVIGGTWVRLANTQPTTVQDRRLHLMMFRRVDGIKVIGATFEGYQVAKYCINLGDVSKYFVDSPYFHDTISDGLHINGPAYGGIVRSIRGKTEDDILSYTAADYAQFNDTSGDIVDCEVTGVFCEGGKSGVKVLGGGQYKIRGLTVRDIRGWVTRRPVYIADDFTGPSDVSVTIDDLRCVPGDTYNTVFINATNAKNVVLRNIEPVVTATQTVPPIQLATGAVVDSLTIDGFRAQDIATATLSMLQVNTGCTVNELQISGASVAYTAISSATAYAILGTVKRFKLAGAHHYKNAKAVVKHDSAAAAMSVDTSPNVSLENCDLGIWTTSVNALDVTLAGGLWDSFGGYVRSGSTGALSVRGPSPRGLRVVTAGIRRDSTAAVRVVSDAMPVDVSLLTKAMGDRAHNTNAALTCGVGPVVSDGTNWKNLYSGAIY